MIRPSGIQPITDLQRKAEDEQKEARFLQAIREGEQAIADGRIRPARDVFSEIRDRLGL